MPTTVVETIGSGGTYATIAAWESATTLNLVSLDQIRVGELLNQAHEMNMGAVTIAGATTDATRYRVLRNAGGASGRFKPYALTGPIVYAALSNGTVNESAILVNESNFRMEGFGIIVENQKDADSGTKIGVDINNCSNVSANAIFVKMAEGGIPGDTLGMTCFRVGSANTTTNARLFNCIAMGGRYRNGGQQGFLFSSFASGGGAYNCWAHSMVRSVGSGFLSLPISNRPELVNCISTNCQSVCFGGLWSKFQNNVSSDYTGTPDGSTGGITAQSSTSLGLKPDAQDFRLKITALALNAGVSNATLMISTIGKADDFEGVTRVGDWEIGPYNGYSDPVTNIITEVQNTVGPGMDYTDLDDWEAATRKNCYYEAKRYIALVDRLGTYNANSAPYRFRRAVATSVAYREVRAATTLDRYQPRSGIGVLITGNGGAGTGDIMPVDIREDFFRMSGVGVNQTNTGSAARSAIRITGHDFRIDSVFAIAATGTATSTHCWNITGSNGLVINSIAKGSGSAGTGAARGFLVLECINTRLFNCIADRIKGGAGGNGFHEGLNTSGVQFGNCISVNNDIDFQHDTGAVPGETQFNNISSDATAAGPGSLKNQTPLSVMVAAGLNDFRIPVSSPAINAGRNLLSFFGTDFDGKPRFAPFDIGVYEGQADSPPLNPIELLGHDEHRICVGYEIVRTDGVSFFLTDSSAPILHNAQTYTPFEGVSASAFRSESGLREVSQTLVGAIEASVMTDEDFAAGKFRGARCIVRLLDPRFPFASPIDMHVLQMGDAQFDGSSWEVEIRGIGQRLEQRAGEDIGPLCTYVLGAIGTCNQDISADIQDSKAVTSITDDRREFAASSISGTYADDFFGYGEFVWLTGDNAGIEARVKVYTQTGRVIKLEQKTPFPIQVGDTFRMKPGCRRRYVEDCIGKFQNGQNHGGEPLAPNTDRSIQTPIR